MYVYLSVFFQLATDRYGLLTVAARVTNPYLLSLLGSITAEALLGAVTITDSSLPGMLAASLEAAPDRNHDGPMLDANSSLPSYLVASLVAASFYNGPVTHAYSSL